MARTIDLKKIQREEVVEQKPIVLPRTEKKDVAIGKAGLPAGRQVFVPDKIPQTFSWHAPLYLRDEGSRIPNIVAGTLFMIAVLFIYFPHDYITGILFILIGLMIAVNARRSIPIVRYEVGPRFVLIGEHAYPYEKFKSFSLAEDLAGGTKEIILRAEKWHQMNLHMPLADTDAGIVRLILLEFIPEEPYQESAVEIFSRRLGF